MEREFILNIGNEPCVFLQAFHVSKLPNLHAEPHALSLSPCLPDQFVPLCVQGSLCPFHASEFGSHGSGLKRMEHPAAGQHDERLTKTAIKPPQWLTNLSNKIRLHLFNRN